MALYTYLLIVLMSVHCVHSFGSGAPFSTCFTQYPKHDDQGTQTTPSPYKFKFTPSAYKPGQEVQIEVTDSSGGKFMGIQIAARRSAGNKDVIVGRFVQWDTSKLKAFNCFDGYQNMLTHSHHERVTRLTFKWEAPSENVGNVVFLTTIVRSYDVFWYGIKAQLPVDSTGPLMPAKYPAIPLAQQSSVTDIDFGGCGSSKGCFFYPSHCSGSDCLAAASYRYKPGASSNNSMFEFELYANHDIGYISLGFSHDEWMGNDATMSCTGRNGGQKSVQEGFNPLQFNDRHFNIFSSGHEVKDQDGKLYCRFVLPEMFEVYQVIQNKDSSQTVNTTWNLKTNYYLMMAWGKAMPESSVMAHHHEYPAISLSKVDLTEKVITHSSAFHLLVRAHGAVLMVAWILITGIVTVVARHYREWMPRTRWFGTKVWFQIHRGLAVLVFVLTAIGITLIFANYGPEIRKHALTHAGVGLSVLACVCLQVIAGMLRPGGDHKIRPYFNWGHWALGHITHILSAVTLFLAFDIKYITSDLKQMGFIVLAVWVAVDVVWQVVFEIIRWRRTQRSTNLERVQDNQFKIVGQDKNDNSTSDVILLCLYTFCLVGLCVAALTVFLLY